MDELNSQFGRLSTNAAEWRPSAQVGAPTGLASTAGAAMYQSDLNASEVKEFVPGQGWAASGVQQSTPQTEQQYREAVGETLGLEGHHSSFLNSVPTGASPAPLPAFRAIHSLGVSDATWSHLREMSLESMRQMEPGDERHKEVLLPYCNAFCLDGSNRKRRSSFGYPGKTFLVTNREDGHLYCLHRFDDVRSVSPKIATAVTDRWTQESAVLEHPGVVPLYRCFVAQRAVFFVHQYIPGARTLAERCVGGPLSEVVLWSCISQLVSALRVVHQNNLAVRTLDLHHVLSNTDANASRLRLRLNCLGVVDALEFEARRQVSDLQRQDIRDFGWLILSLAAGTEVNGKSDSRTVSRCEAFVSQNFSRELHNLAVTLIRSSSHPPSILDISRAISQRALDEQDLAYRSLDLTENLLMAEYESGRALRLLLKLGFVNERPEFGPDQRWSESGDCYVLSLFRDYVFHQADGGGYPVMDLGHVITALNKLDAGDEEKIVLASRDGKSMMVVTYADVARCLENAFGELCSNAVPPSSLQYS